MQIEIRNPAAPDGVVATCDETSTSALDDHFVREEVFGPVLSAIALDTVDEAASAANDIAFGLSSCPYSERAGLVKRFVVESESGMLHVNAGNVPEIQLPPVGIKDGTVGAGGSNGPATHPVPCHQALGRSPGQRVRAH